MQGRISMFCSRTCCDQYKTQRNILATCEHCKQEKVLFDTISYNQQDLIFCSESESCSGTKFTMTKHCGLYGEGSASHSQASDERMTFFQNQMVELSVPTSDMLYFCIVRDVFNCYCAETSELGFFFLLLEIKRNLALHMHLFHALIYSKLISPLSSSSYWWSWNTTSLLNLEEFNNWK